MFETCVVKLTSYCNLDCTYCYMFNLGDETYRRMPRNLSVETASAFLSRVGDYLAETGRQRFQIVLHGGEPSLWPLAHFERFFGELHAVRARGYDIACSMQTNAYAPMATALLDLLAQHDVGLGISLDGPPAQNDAFRVTRGGKGSYARVMATIEGIIARGYGSLVGGFLAVANPAIPIDEYMAWIQTLPRRRLDVLWPIEFNYDHLPWAETDADAYRRAPRYGMWFADLFRAWWALDDPELVIRSFYNIVQVFLGGRAHVDAIVNDTVDMFVLNTSGAVEYPDYLRAARDGGASTPYDIHHTPIGAFERDAVFQMLFRLADHLPSACLDCPQRPLCGGGFLPGRTGRTSTLLPRRSVLCYDEFHFFSAVDALLRDACAARGVLPALDAGRPPLGPSALLPRAISEHAS